MKRVSRILSFHDIYNQHDVIFLTVSVTSAAGIGMALCFGVSCESVLVNYGKIHHHIGLLVIQLVCHKHDDCIL